MIHPDLNVARQIHIAPVLQDYICDVDLDSGSACPCKKHDTFFLAHMQLHAAGCFLHLRNAATKVGMQL